MIERMLFTGFLKKRWPAQDKRTHHMLVRVTAMIFRHAARLTPQCPVGPPSEAGMVSRLQRPPHVAIRSWSAISADRAEASGYQLYFTRIVAQTLAHHDSRPAGNSCWNG